MPFDPQSSTASTSDASCGANASAGCASTAATRGGGQRRSNATRRLRSAARSSAMLSSSASASLGCSTARTLEVAGIDTLANADVPGSRRWVDRPTSPASVETTSSRVSTALPPLTSFSSRSNLSASAGLRRAESRSSPTLRVTCATWIRRSGRLPLGQATSVASAPSVTSQFSVSVCNSAAGGADTAPFVRCLRPGWRRPHRSAAPGLAMDRRALAPPHRHAQTARAARGPLPDPRRAACLARLQTTCYGQSTRPPSAQAGQAPVSTC